MIDSHAHLNNDLFKSDLELVIKESKKKLEKILLISCDFIDFEEHSKIKNKDKNFFYHAVGLHPVEVANFKVGDLKKLEKLIIENEIVAIGEIGLDYHWHPEQKEEQKYFFEEQLKIAKNLNLPYIIHCREAYEDCFEIIKNNRYYNGVIHSFSSNLDMAMKFIDLGLYIGISGPITFKNGIDQKEVAKTIPIDKILIETDAPYLTPVPYRGKRNEPKYVEYILEEISFQRKISKEEATS